jgi:hypothetical protein
LGLWCSNCKAYDAPFIMCSYEPSQLVSLQPVISRPLGLRNAALLTRNPRLGCGSIASTPLAEA